MQNNIFENLFVLKLANNLCGDNAKLKKIINDFTKIVRLNNLKKCILERGLKVEQKVNV